MMDVNRFTPFRRDVVITIVTLYAASGLIFWTQFGPWEAIRNVGGNGLILIAWLWAAGRILGDNPIPELEPIRRPRVELAWSLATLLIVIALAANAYAGWVELPSATLSGFMIVSVLLLFIVFRYPLKDLGLRWPSKRGWMALLVVVLINFAISAMFVLAPPGEAQTIPQADLSNQISGPWSVVILIVGLLLRAALPEELLLRVTLQPRLARFLPIGWAILLQGLLFSLGHVPQRMIGYQEPLLIALAYTLIVNNGLLGGYLWLRTRSLPLLLLLHLFAYPRFGI
jgi:membrane protease YdiL (CAAX protease family)